jgi:hypothetical protein
VLEVQPGVDLRGGNAGVQFLHRAGPGLTGDWQTNGATCADAPA